VFDLHSHLLPGVDDGSESPPQSATVLERFKSEGVVGVCLTPHLLASAAAAGVPEAHGAAWEALRQVAPEGIVLYRGAEVMLDRPLDAKVAEERVVTLNATRYLLVEFPRLVAEQAASQAVANIARLGLVPIVAHPERYACCSPRVVGRWKELGALIQLDGPTLLSSRGRGVRARELLQHGLADIAAGDNHGDDRGLKPLWDALHEQEGGAMTAQLLLRKNPEAILADQEPAPLRPFTMRLALIERVRGLLGRGREERT